MEVGPISCMKMVTVVRGNISVNLIYASIMCKLGSFFVVTCLSDDMNLAHHFPYSCQDSLPSCDNAALNPCDPATEVCAQTESGLQCYPKTVCELLGDSDCTEPFEGFFEELAVQGSFTSTSNEDAIKTWIKEHVWNSLSMDELIAQVPSEYVIAASESSEEAGETESISQLRLNEFLEV